MKKFSALLLILTVFCISAAESVHVFTPGNWNMEDWMLVKSGRWSYIGAWEQQDNCITNKCPKDATAAEMEAKRAPETFTSMLLKKHLAGNCRISSKMSFDSNMAPLIVISGPTGTDMNSYPEYREHWEIVLYNQGLNVWHHEWKDGKPYWRKAAFVNAKFESGKQYELKLDIQFTSKVPQLVISCEDVVFGCMLPSLPQEYQVGITGCEGVCRFYDFKLNQ